MGCSPRFISLSTEFATERVAKTWLVVGEYRGSLDSWIREDIKLLRAWDRGAENKGGRTLAGPACLLLSLVVNVRDNLFTAQGRDEGCDREA